jgi:predicted dehydrogenase
VHVPGLRLCKAAEIVALCDADAGLLARRSQEWGVAATYSDYAALLAEADVAAVVVATPNDLHRPIALAAVAAGKHVLVEKPLGLNHAETVEMLRAAEAAGVQHMTAFTYRFVPAMRYLQHLIDRGDLGEPRHFRSQRFQDFGPGSLGWRQEKARAGTGELGDMGSHRIDYGHLLLGPVRRVLGWMKQFLPERVDRNGTVHPSDVEDWVAWITEFENGATGVFEMTKLATARGGGGHSHDLVEINGTEATAIYQLNRPHELIFGQRGGTLETIPVPEEWLKTPVSNRDPHEGDPTTTFRYDQAAEFIDAILHARPCIPSFADGARCQEVLDAIVRSAEEGRWVEVTG